MVDVGQVFVKGGRETTPAGAYEARILKIVDLGKQLPSGKYSKFKNGEQKPATTLLHITYELFSDELSEGSAIEGEFINLVYGKKAKYSSLLKALGIKFGDSYNLSDLIGMPLSVSVVHEEKEDGEIRVKIDNRSAVSSSVQKMIPELTKEPVFFNSDDPDFEILKTLPKFHLDSLLKAENASDDLKSMVYEVKASKAEGADTGDM